MATNNGGGIQLPEDVVVEILSWLPVKALLRFKCVCKLWYSILTSSDFISKHLNSYYNCRNGRLLVHLDRIANPPDETLEDLSHQPFHLPFPATICGPCNGIYYLDTGKFSDGALWNPATKEQHLLPRKLTEPDLPPSPDVPGFDYPAFLSSRSGRRILSKSNETGLPPYLQRVFDAYGFGFDETTEDYKVVIVRILWDHSRGTSHYPSSAILYSLRTNSWRYWGGLAQRGFLTRSTCYTYVKGIFYWLGWREMPPKFILSFDFNKDSFEEIPAPNDPGLAYNEALATYHYSIAFFMIHLFEKLVDIWVIDDEGYWTKKFTIAPPLEIDFPVGYWTNGEIFLQCSSSSGTIQLFSCDPSTQEVRDLGFESSTGFGISELLIYKESLVSIKDICLQPEEQ